MNESSDLERQYVHPLPINERIFGHQLERPVAFRVSRNEVAQAECQQSSEGVHPEAV